MIGPTSNAAHAAPVAPSGGTAPKKAAKPAAQPAAQDSVQLSKAAQARLAAAQELRETAAQTSKEASTGDRQARRLLAKESAKSGK
jgi:hypothetical protein